MSRRRRLLPTSSRDSDNTTEAAHDFRRPQSELRSPDAQLWHFKRRTTIHPSLTNYGPESLQCFLQNELEKLKNNTLQAQRRQIIEHAKFLVNNPGELCIASDDATQRFTIEPVDDAYRTANAADKGKGKAPLRRSSRQKSSVKAIEPDSSDWQGVTNTRGDLETTIHHATRSFSKSKSASSSAVEKTHDINPPLSNSIDDGTSSPTSDRPTTGSQTDHSIGHALHNIDLNQSIPRTIQASLRADESQAALKSQFGPRRNFRDIGNYVEDAFDSNSLNDLTLLLESGPATINPVKPVPPIEVASTPGQMTRSASFENHADHTRDFRRTKDKASLSSDRLSEESRRRRKTPAHSKNRLSENIAPAQMTRSLQFMGASYDPSSSSQTVAGHMSDVAVNTVLPAGISDAQPSNSKTMRTYANLSANLDQDSVMFNSQDEDEASKDIILKDITSAYGNVEEQRAILASLTPSAAASSVDNPSNPHVTQKVVPYDYSQIVPEDLPRNFKQAAINRDKIWQAHGHDSRGKPQKRRAMTGPFTTKQLDPEQDNILNALDEFGDYKRPYVEPSRRGRPGEPPFCPPPIQVQQSLPHEIWEAGVLRYLSSSEVRTLRLVCKSIAEDLELYVFRNVVTKFGPNFFNIETPLHSKQQSDAIEPMTMLKKFGPGINKFGISFEYDPLAMVKAPFKITETMVDAWFGDYKWPVKDYPYFAPLKGIDTLLDDQPRLLLQAMKHLTSCHELALSVDSGHGWLEGADMSDLALYRDRAGGGSKVFGKTFPSDDKAHDKGMRHLFEWAQRNTINENIKHHERSAIAAHKEIEKFRDVVIRNYDSYRVQHQQPDFEQDLHTGKEFVAPTQPNDRPLQGVNPMLSQAIQQNPAGMAQYLSALGNHTPLYQQALQTPQFQQALNALHAVQQQAVQGHQYPQNAIPQQNQTAVQMYQNQQVPPTLPHATNAASSQVHRQRVTEVLRIVASRAYPSRAQEAEPERIRKAIQPQWPIIFNGYNISADVGGDSSCIQERVSNPSDYPLTPGDLKEAQAQWLMETSWIQRTFLTSYTDAIRTNAAVFKNVHSLHISKMSSGLLSSLAQKTFWTSLPKLRRVTIFVKPDWRLEHVPGDKLYRTTMNTKLIDASLKFGRLLKDVIARIENLNDLHIGYCSGGEHQKGIFGRNQHILPAPIVSNPREWLLAQNPANTKPDEDTMLIFPHIRNLTFENCWLSPLMLETFMQKSRDSSLHNLILSSVSLTAQVHSTRTDGPLRTFDHHLKCLHPPGAWLQEIVPANASWANVLDNITPGRTIQDQKYDAGMINEEQNPRPEAQFRGNVQSISLKSCGYAKIQNISSTEFNQNDLVFHSNDWHSFDDGLRLRAAKFVKTHYVVENITPARPDGPGSPTAHAVPTTYVWAGNRAVRESEIKERRSISSQFMMQGGQTAHDLLSTSHTVTAGYYGSHMTGFLTQCIHPVEKRILEQNWGMKFGWGDDMKRWEAVEDGWFIGGTGRFSGTVYKDRKMQERQNALSMMEAAKTEAASNEANGEKAQGDYAHLTRSVPGFPSFPKNSLGTAGPSRTRQMDIEEAIVDDLRTEDDDDWQGYSEDVGPVLSIE